MIRVGIVGASGYGGAEVLRLIQAHPEFRLTYLASESDAGKPLASVFPQFRGVSDVCFEAYVAEKALELADVFFLPVSNGRAMKLVPGLLEAGRKVLDFSADFRLRDQESYEKTYGIPHTCPELLHEAVYGLVETNRDAIKAARLVANPGCYPTAAILSILPLLGHPLLHHPLPGHPLPGHPLPGHPLPGGTSSGRDRETPLADPSSIIVDAYSGVSGAGRSSFSLDYHFPEVNESLTAYKVIGHRHTREIEQEVSARIGRPAAITFTPHLAPVNRGILETIYATLLREMTGPELREVYQEAYKDDRFVVVLPDGEMPRTGSVRGSNYVQMSVSVDPRLRRATIVAAQDNLVKGMCGQAVQSMNLLCGLPEEMGLLSGGFCP